MSSHASRVQTWLRDSAVYQRLKASYLYDAYWSLTNEAIIAQREKEVSFYRGFLDGLKNGDLIFDIGANHGYKTDMFLRLGARVIAVDPDALNQTTLARRFLAYRLRKKPVTIVGKAVSDEASVRTLWVEAPGSAKNTLSDKWVDVLRADTQRFGENLGFAHRQEVQTVTLSELIVEYGRPFFVKIDVEGHEPQVLQGLKEPVPYLSFEINLPEFLDEGLLCVQLMHGIDPRVQFNLAGTDLGAGLLLSSWVDASEFADVLRKRQEQSLEVFCRTPVVDRP
jgi:FkbM family methyltransferase